MRVRNIRSERPSRLRHEARELDVQPRRRRARPAAEHRPLRDERADLTPDLHAVRAERGVRLAVEQARGFIQRPALPRIKIHREQHGQRQSALRRQNIPPPPSARELRQHQRA